VVTTIDGDILQIYIVQVYEGGAVRILEDVMPVSDVMNPGTRTPGFIRLCQKSTIWPSYSRTA
jgi:hypothetical protein